MRTQAVLVLCSILVTLGGCTGLSRQTMELDPAVSGGRLAVENTRGAVTVMVDPSLRTGRVEATMRLESVRRAGEQDAAAGALALHAELVDGVYTVRTGDVPEGAWIDVRVFTPSSPSLRVVNRGGKVTLRGVRGRVDVQNDGKVEVGYAAALREAVTVRSETGPVLLVLPQGSEGSFSLTSEGGDSSIVARAGTLREVHLRGGQDWFGAIGDGTNAVVLACGTGDVSVHVLDR